MGANHLECLQRTSDEGTESMSGLIQRVRGLMPRSAKTALRKAALSVGLRWIDWEFRHGRIPSQRVFALARFGWGNSAWDADEEYLRVSCEMIRQSPSDVLECGSGLSTIIYGLALRGQTIRLVALEHQREWFDRVNVELVRTGGQTIELIRTPLISYGEFDWYDWPSTLRDRRFGTVICDGPPSTTKGGRYGLLPVTHEQLQSPVTILLDDSSREGEQYALHRWSTGYGAAWEDHPSGQFSIVTAHLEESST